MTIWWNIYNNSYKPITNTAWVRARLCKIQKGYTRLASDKAYQLLAHGRWSSPGSPAFSTTKTGRYDIAEILLNVALNTKNQIKSYHIIYIYIYIIYYFLKPGKQIHDYINNSWGKYKKRSTKTGRYRNLARDTQLYE